MPAFTENGVSLNYQTFGDPKNPAIVFSNSLGTNFSMWQPQIKALQDAYYVIAYDTRGHGASSTPNGPYHLRDLGMDVVRLLQYLQVKQATFCGISMGGLTGQWLAIHQASHFKGVIVANTAAKVGLTQAWLERAQSVREHGLGEIAKTAASRWFTDAYIAQHADVIASMSQNLAAGSAEGYASCCEALAHADLREDIKNIVIPVLVITGNQDPVTTVADGEYMHKHIPNSQLVTLAASHISNIEATTAFTQAVRDFVAA